MHEHALLIGNEMIDSAQGAYDVIATWLQVYPLSQV